MPYTKQNIPNGVKKLPDKAQNIFISAFNSAFKEDPKDEKKAFSIAWKAVEKAGYKKTDYTNTSNINNGKGNVADNGKGVIDNKNIKACESFHYMVALSENNNKLVEIMRIGKWKHPSYGDLEISNNTLDNIIMNFNDNVRGVNICIDLEHGESSYKGEAAGWIKNLRKKDNRLLAEIDWTKLGEEKLKNKIYRYFSPEFKFLYQDAETGKNYNNVLFGGSLTNRPFIKGMNPVMLSEDINTNYCKYIESNKKEDDYKMNSKLLEVLKLSENSTDEDINKAVDKLIESTSKFEETNIKLDELNKSIEKLTNDNKTLVKEKEVLTTKLSETNKGKSTIEEDNIKLSEKVKNIESKLLDAEWDKVSSIALSEGKLTQKMLPQFEKSFKADPTATRDMINVLQPVINLSEEGSSKGNEEISNIQLFEQEVNKYMNEHKVDYTVALSEVEKSNPDLFKLFDKERRGL